MVSQNNTPIRKGSRRAPLIFTQAVVVAVVSCLAQLLCAPVYVGLSYDSLALIPWSAIACLLAVMFSYTVGFAALWAAGRIARKAPAPWRPVIVALFGLILFGIWGYLVFAAALNSVIVPLGHAALSGTRLGTIGFNCAAVGLASFFCAAVFGERCAAYRTWVWVAFACTLACAGAGVLYAVHIAAVLY